MKPPRLINLAAAVSLLLAVVIVVLWVRSYARDEMVTRIWSTSNEQRAWTVQSVCSSLDFAFARIPGAGPIAPSYEYRDFGRDSVHPLARHWFPFPPVRFQRYFTGIERDPVTELTLAYWLLLPPTLILPTIAIARHRRRRRREAGNLCPTCGYDLRAHNAGDRCPECGMVPASSA